MSSPPQENPILSSSPISVRGSSPVRRRNERDNSNDAADSSVRAPRMSPTLMRSYDPNDPEVRERQRTMDVDMALHLSRARSNTVASPTTSPYEPSPIVHPHPVHPHSQDDLNFPSLSCNEEHDLNMARGARIQPGIAEVSEADLDLGVADEPRQFEHSPSPIGLPFQHLSAAHDPTLLAGIPHAAHEDPSASLTGLPTYQANAPGSVYDFGPLEDYSSQERTRLGLAASSSTAVQQLRQRQVSTRLPADTHEHDPEHAHVHRHHDDGVSAIIQSPPSGAPPFNPSSDSVASSTAAKQVPHRKLSESKPAPRPNRKGIRGKMALFENQANGSPSRLLPEHLRAGPSSEDLPPAPPGGDSYFPNGMGSMGGMMGGIINTGHDRPYRFSFYSNALSQTIHARSLSELPSEGQTFEDLFSGMQTPVPPPPGSGSGSNSRGTTANANARSEHFEHGDTTPRNGKKQDAQAGNGNGYFRPDVKNGAGGPARLVGGGDEYQGKTWWLDVLSPTDEEMRVLSKVFAIHPLTTEDIQMEEAREKIELFRNYYLVCFRSFDQDPYSPTHLEPLNMYIIVFREGILSFHFRPTPHPQNVRRRIKQLKDYISVTSDWISYALIDDITDAFGPLIQSIEYEVDSIDELVLILKETEQSDMLRRIGTCRKKVMGLLRLMGNKADVVKGLAKRCNENWRVAPTSDIGLYLSDIQDHLITMTQNLNHYEKILSRSHSNYLAQISIEMTDANNQINDVLSKMTALGTVLIPMNLVTGLWGMNVHVPGQDVPGYAWFSAIVGALATFAVIGGYTTYKFMIRR